MKPIQTYNRTIRFIHGFIISFHKVSITNHCFLCVCLLSSPPQCNGCCNLPYIYIYIYTLVFPGGPQHCSYGCVYVFRKRRCQCVWSPQWWWQLRAQGKESSLKNRHSPGLISVSHLYQVALEGLWVPPHLILFKKKKSRKKKPSLMK